MEKRDINTGDAQPSIPIVDAHHHLWDLRLGHYPWLQDRYDPSSFFLGDYAQLCRNFLPADLLRDSEHCGLIASVHIEAERDRGQQLAETVWLHEQAAVYGFPNAVVPHVWLDRPDTEEQLLAHMAYPLVRGIRCKPLVAPAPDQTNQVFGQPGSMQHESWLRGMALLQKHGLSWDLRVPWWHLSEAAEVAAQFPELTIILNHHGLAWDRSTQGLQRWRTAMEALARYPNVHVKLSEFGLRNQIWNAEDNAHIVREVIAIFGWQRCLFASNFPVAGLRISYPALILWMRETLAYLDQEQQRAVLGGNALSVYRIDTSAGLPTPRAKNDELLISIRKTDE